MKKRMLLAAGMAAVALLFNGCATGEGSPQTAVEDESASMEMGSEAESVNNAEESSEETEKENTDAVSESAESQIPNALQSI